MKAISIDTTASESALQLDAERSAIRAEREQATRFRDEMLGIVGHDLRAPLGAIIIATEMLAMEVEKDSPAAHAVTRIVSFANRMTRMVDQVLDMTRARLGSGIPLARCETRLSPLLQSAIRDLALVHPGTQFALVAATEVRGVWDADRLGQVVVSLLNNAVQYGQKNAPITVGVSRSDGTATITVHNQLGAQPIPPDALATLFEPYRRGDRIHAGTGLGLGLYLAREVVRAHGGIISVESSPAGTTFKMVLPEAPASG